MSQPLHVSMDSAPSWMMSTLPRRERPALYRVVKTRAVGPTLPAPTVCCGQQPVHFPSCGERVFAECGFDHVSERDRWAFIAVDRYGESRGLGWAS